MSESQCAASHPNLDNGAQCRFLEGHLAANLPHTTPSGIYWYPDPELKGSGS